MKIGENGINDDIAALETTLQITGLGRTTKYSAAQLNQWLANVMRTQGKTSASCRVAVHEGNPHDKPGV